MLLRTASRALPRCRAVCRRLPCRAAALASSGAPSTCSFSVASLAATASVTVQRRWCTTGPSFASSSPPPSSASHAGSVAPPPSTATTTTTTNTTRASDDSLLASVAEQLKALSPEDQQRILSALHAPEKEKSSAMGGAGIGPANGEMVAAFTCGPCDYRMVKRFSKHAYTKGIVIVECPNCRARHLLADNLGWMEDSATNIEDILKAKGESFVHIGGTDGDYQVVAGHADLAAGEETKTSPAPSS